MKRWKIEATVNNQPQEFSVTLFYRDGIPLSRDEAMAHVIAHIKTSRSIIEITNIEDVTE